MKKVNLGFLALLVVGAAGCGDEGGGSDQQSDALVETCSGTFECTLQGESFQQQIERRDGT